MRVLILGRGKVGSGLTRALRDARVEVKLASPRTAHARHLATADVVVLAVPDGAVGATARAIAGHTKRGAVVLHCAGALTASEVQDAGAPGGVMHPLVSFADPRATPDLVGTTFVIAGHPSAVARARAIARACGARPVVADVQGPAYHAAAALVANGAAALATAGVSILRRLGMEQRAAERALGQLLRTVSHNVEALGVPGALTGPVSRGDAATVAGHRAALPRKEREDYDAVAPVIVRAARSQGLGRAKLDGIRRVLRAPIPRRRRGPS